MDRHQGFTPNLSWHDPSLSDFQVELRSRDPCPMAELQDIEGCDLRKVPGGIDLSLE
jgi:hypothetical protein